MGGKTFTKEDFEVLLGDDGLRRYYNKIKGILREYMDLDEDYYSLTAIWIIGTYLHKQFSSYPYLFFNAMKGSGKSRMLKILANLSHNGKMVGAMTEAVLFRTASNRTLCIDELEDINSKGNENLRLLLNSAYKRGLTVERMTKKKSKEGESQEVEEFEVYAPIAMANIWGIDNTLSDRCITLILEKSSNPNITRLIEDFENDVEFQKITGGLLRLTENITPDLRIFADVITQWNRYQRDEIDNLDNNYIFTSIFKNILNTELIGRDLELFFPLFILADIIGEQTLKELMATAIKLVNQRKESDREENRDTKLYEFIAQSGYTGYIEVAEIVNGLKRYFGEDEKWINSRGIGMALRRLKLVLDKRSTGKNRQVKLHIEKAIEKTKIFQSSLGNCCKEVKDVNNVSKEDIVLQENDVNFVNEVNKYRVIKKTPELPVLMGTEIQTIPSYESGLTIELTKQYADPLLHDGYII